MNIYPNIYRIDKGHRSLKRYRDAGKIIRRIISTSHKRLEWKEETELPVKSFSKDNLTYHLYLHNTDDKVSEWASFLPPELANDERFIQKKLSLILFVETEFELFAIVGGSAFRLIVPFIDHSFGLNTYDRIIEITEDELTSMKSRGITGQRIASNEQNREDYRIINYIKFGKVPQELLVKLALETGQTYFPSLIEKKDERLQISAGKSFKIRKTVTFDQFHQIISDLCIVLSEAPKEYLSSYIEISDPNYIQELYDALHSRIYNSIAYELRINNDPKNKFEFDFCNPNNVEKFFEAEKYVLKEKTEDSHRIFATVEDRSLIYATVLEYAYGLYGDNAFKIKVFLNGVRVLGYQGNKIISSSTFVYHISAELTYKDKSVFLIDTKWYHLKDIFINDLKIQTERIIRTFKAPINILNQSWNKLNIAREDQYNMLYNDVKNYIVVDKIITDGVELCDILYYDENNLYLIHVKYGFDSRIRELTNQILISARRLSEAKSSGNRVFFNRLYDSLLTSRRNVNNLTKEDFFLLFSKKIIYVIAFTSHLKDDYLIEDNIDKFNSNIARFSLVTCSTDIRNYYELMILQIPRV